MSVFDFLQVLDTTFPIEPPSWIWAWALGLFIGEFCAFLITAFGIYYASKKQVSLFDSFMLSLVVTLASFTFGVLYWISIGFW